MLNTLYQTEDLKHGRGSYPFKYGKKHGNGNGYRNGYRNGNDYELVFDLVQAKFEKDPDMCKEEQPTCNAYNKVW